MNKNEIYLTLHSEEDATKAKKILETYGEPIEKSTESMDVRGRYKYLHLVDGDWYVFSMTQGKTEVTLEQLEEILSKERNLKEQPAVYDFVNPQHYKKMSVETWEMMVSIWGAEKYVAHCEMCAFKYRMRLGEKPDQPVERDLEKARWHEDMAKRIRDEHKLG